MALCVWVTRAQPGADETAQRLVSLGHLPLIAPVLEVRGLPAAPLDVSDVGALAFTSANGVRAFAAIDPSRDLPVFAVGDATAKTARAVGFSRVEAGCTDVAALGQLIVGARHTFANALLHPCALHPAGDLVGHLNRAGLPARALPVYDTVERDALPEAAGRALDDSTMDVVLLQSPRAARAVARLMDPPERRCQAERLAAVGLSRACLAPLAGLPFAQARAAGFPTQADLLAELARL